MVKLRGIEICIISQFDICRIPEFRYPRPYQAPADPFQVRDTDSAREETKTTASAFSYPTASCYVPVYPGSQIWFEYTVDGPHPPGAAYFFKLYLNNKVVTAWDCTAKHGFHGKMMYNLVVDGDGGDPAAGELGVRRLALRFGDGVVGQAGHDVSKTGKGVDRHTRDGWQEDVIQINVHRIEHRRRVRDLQPGLGFVDVNGNQGDGLRLTDSGLLEPGFRPKRYQYQLLDPLDMPYAAFRFYCRPFEYLETRGITRLRDWTSPRSSMSSGSTASQVSDEDSQHNTGQDTHQRIDSSGSPLTSSQPHPASSHSHGMVSTDLTRGNNHPLIRVVNGSVSIPLSDSDDSLSVRTKDSIEELPSLVTRSPKSPRSPGKRLLETRLKTEAGIPPSPTRSPMFARHHLKKKLTVNISGAEFDVERKKRPLSPFTSSGLLRKACILPQTAPAAVTEFGPTVEDEVREEMNKTRSDVEAKEVSRTTRAERGGSKLMGFLGRRINREK
ncbi:hypothetical protein A1O1_05936 [Capronia coronata CBS 617.96]|uniref:Uncharacterized protein n=1 Tax=Capronia coronata CBS 617.96 TaxID=1182541 RepID=W9Y8K2_9EURO|nr:uncharacterized protein A1O1_05936 [Capronia coronata CBS 617.96]EXJ85571.1 hypothetical protein A1O1_05936 [Capronia coronata CBS 617.96]